MRDKTNFSKNSTTLTWKSRSHVRILIYRTWPFSSYTESMILHDKWRILQLYVESKTIRVVWCWSKSGNSYTVTGIPAVLVIQELSARCDVPARLKATKQISNWHFLLTLILKNDHSWLSVILSSSVIAISWNLLSFSSLLHIFLTNLFSCFLSVPRSTENEPKMTNYGLVDWGNPSFHSVSTLTSQKQNCQGRLALLTWIEKQIFILKSLSLFK